MKGNLELCLDSALAVLGRDARDFDLKATGENTTPGETTDIARKEKDQYQR